MLVNRHHRFLQTWRRARKIEYANGITIEKTSYKNEYGVTTKVEDANAVFVDDTGTRVEYTPETFELKPLDKVPAVHMDSTGRIISEFNKEKNNIVIYLGNGKEKPGEKSQYLVIDFPPGIKFGTKKRYEYDAEKKERILIEEEYGLYDKAGKPWYLYIRKITRVW